MGAYPAFVCIISCVESLFPSNKALIIYPPIYLERVFVSFSDF